MAVEIIGTSGNIADVDASGNLKVNIEASSGGTTTVVQPSGANLHVDIDNFPATQPVSGAVSVNNFPATQPVSGTLVAEIEGHAGAVLDGTAGTPSIGVLTVQGVGGGTPQPVSGTVSVNNFPATQPVSAAALPLPTNAAQETSGNLATIASNTTTIALNTTNETSGAAKTQVSDPTSLVAANVVAKGVQAVNALGTQALKDAGRTYIVLYADRIAGATTEALVTMNINKGGTLTSGTSYTISAGKTFRISSVNVEIQNTTTAANRVLIRVRSAVSLLVTSPIIAMALAAAQAAIATAGDTDPHSFPDGIEIASGQQVGVSQLCTVTTAGIVSFTVIGYEY